MSDWKEWFFPVLLILFLSLLISLVASDLSSQSKRAYEVTLSSGQVIIVTGRNYSIAECGVCFEDKDGIKYNCMKDVKVRLISNTNEKTATTVSR
jgi:hypothetical protein